MPRFAANPLMRWRCRMDCKCVHTGWIPVVASNSPTRSSRRAIANGARAASRRSAGLPVRRLLDARLRLAFAAMPPYSELAAPAPHHRQIDRQHEKPERDHPEAEHGQEAEQAAGDQQNAEPDADRLQLRQLPVAIEQADFVGHRGARARGGSKPDIRAMRRRRNPRRRRAGRQFGGLARSSGKPSCLLLSTRS